MEEIDILFCSFLFFIFFTETDLSCFGLVFTAVKTEPKQDKSVSFIFHRF